MRSEKLYRKPSYRVSKKQSYEEGFEDGYSAAVSDYLVQVVDLEELSSNRDFNDFYVLGYEAGYTRKLAELAIF